MVNIVYTGRMVNQSEAKHNLKGQDKNQDIYILSRERIKISLDFLLDDKRESRDIENDHNKPLGKCS